ncbi:TonB-dependent siderophore receptor [Pseudomonas vancouverensis]|uniref:TonB-dependent siderophore receptor n=1 Tax=Pseudomonas vancouverensis TaxID=95300 RepID=A0A1H2N981_PSEVA|nr:TonB-dependent siderophore receptor [Pseudomonas vancouverensis]KAB0494056.1 TonB-dependent siderophore receptor [Pseudomonas vancouverensis]TDB61493.1 TonB-dependent siderophore receptor [Pseudomonas vancouverensis]SDV02040.1 outer-membrane receptor for ferric coprogen and ferric-rhodotorulic acid [Pseudomonas vancouverensis]
MSRFYKPGRLATAVKFGLLAATATAAWSGATFAATAATSQQSSVQSFDIAAGSLTEVLSRFASAAGVAISFDARHTDGFKSPGLKGAFGVSEGFARVLGGSGLQAQPQANGTYVLRPAPGAGSALELGATNINAQALGATTENSGSYTTGAVTIGKGEHSLKETPQSVTVITRKMLDDQNLNTIDQVMEKTPGITVYDSTMGGKYFYSRGFRMSGQYQYDGVPLDMGNLYVQADSFSSDMAYYDRVEVLRGAAGMMKGSGGTAGGVNFVRKRGQATAQTDVTLSGGSWDNYRGQVDTGGPLNDSGTIRGRAVVAEQSRHYYVDDANRKDQVYYGALDVDLNPDTTLGLGVAYEDVDANPCWGGMPRYRDGSDLRLGRSTCLDPSWNTWRSKRTTVFADLKHQLNDDWALKVASVYTKNTQDIKYAFASGAVTPGIDTTGVLGSLYDYDQVDYGLDAYVDGKFAAFGQQHELVLGFNASRSNKNDFYSVAFLPQRQNVFNPDKHIPEPDDSYFIENSSRGGPVDSVTKQQGIYSTLRLKLADPLTFVVGSRVSWYSSDTDYDFINSGTSEHVSTKETGQVTPFAGLLLDLDENLTAYTSYSEIFTPQGNYRSEDGSALRPLVGQSYELGIKGAWFNGRLNSSFNLFRTIQKDQAQTDYNSSCPSSDGYCYVNSGKVRAQGFEAEISGEVIERLQLLAGYTYTQTKTLDDLDTSLNGAAFNSYVPRHLLRLWGDYQLDGALERFTVGAGVNAQSDNFRVSPLSGEKISQSGYAVWNGRIGYRIDDTWSVALNGNNLFDKRYYATIGTETFGNYYGDPRNFMVSVKASF